MLASRLCGLGLYAPQVFYAAEGALAISSMEVPHYLLHCEVRLCPPPLPSPFLCPLPPSLCTTHQLIKSH